MRICPELELRMPEKVLFKWQPSVVAEREAAFQLILHSIQKSFILMWQPEVLEFLGFQDVDGSLFQGISLFINIIIIIIIIMIYYLLNSKL